MGTRQSRLGEAVLTSTHNQCFRAKIRKNEYPCKPPVLLYKRGGRGCSLHGHVIMMGYGELFYCSGPCAFHIIILEIIYRTYVITIISE